MSKPARKPDQQLIPVESIQQRIYLIRGHRVMLDRDPAALYCVKPIAMRQQVRRNSNRFPPDFTFQLSRKEAEALLSQNVIPSRRSLRGHLPYALPTHHHAARRTQKPVHRLAHWTAYGNDRGTLSL